MRESNNEPQMSSAQFFCTAQQKKSVKKSRKKKCFFSLFDSFLFGVAFSRVVRAHHSRRRERESFFQIKRETNLARRKKNFFSSSLLSGEQRERERERESRTTTRVVRIKEGEKTREPPTSILLLCFLASSFCDARKSNC